MIGRGHRDGGTRWSGMFILLSVFVALLGAASESEAASCSDYPNGVLDGFAGTIAPSQLQIDRNCTIRNYPASNPLSTNFSFYTQPGQTTQRWLVIFDNVVHTGQMSCNVVAGHKIWFTNGSSTQIQEDCQNLLIPVEKIDKQNPAGQTTATVGVPFTYTLTMPVLYDAGTGTVINTSGSLNDLHGVTLTDDLNATGVDLTYLSHTAYWLSSGAPVSHSFSESGGVLSFGGFPIIPAGQQIIIEITVLLEDTPVNAVGTQFVNTAKWEFGRLIDGVFYEPLPGEWGISPPLTIAAPDLVVTKTGPATLGRTLNLGQLGDFGIDVQNVGLSDAWNVTLLDRLPDAATGGMCSFTPQIVSARVFASDGVTPVPGKGPLVLGSDYSFNYVGAPTCELTLTMLTPAAVIGPGERLVVAYRTQLDSDTQDGVSLTNVVGATQWFNGDTGTPNRAVYSRSLTDGTPAVPDHQDAHTVTAALFGYFFEKSVANLTSGVSPTATATPGDVLRYSLRLQATDVALSNLTFYDDLGALNASPVFVPGSLALVAASLPPGADASNTDPNAGTNGAGILDVRGLNVPANSQILIQFDITLDPTVAEGTIVTNQADLLSTIKLADSDDPNVNGQADPQVPGDEDPTRVVIATTPAGALGKQNTQATASVGETFSYRITVPATPDPFPIYDVRITDDLTASAADMRFVGVTKVSGSGPWTPVNTGTATNLVIEDTTTGIDIPAGEQIVVEVSVVLENTVTNVTGLPFGNTAAYLYNRIDGFASSQQVGPSGTTPPMTIVGPDSLTMDKSGPAVMTIGSLETFTLDVQNTGTGPAWNLTITDQLPDSPNGGTCDAVPGAFTARVYASDGVTAVSPPLVLGTDYSANFQGVPACVLTITALSSAAVLGPSERLIVTYQTQVDADTQDTATLTNVAGATEWFSHTGPDRRTYTRTLTDGTPAIVDHEDAWTTGTSLPQLRFEKTVLNVTTGASPAVTARPGDVLRYRLEVENLNGVSVPSFSLYDEIDRLNGIATFVPGSLTLVTVPSGADTSNTSATGGTLGTGVVDVRNLSLPNLGDTVVVGFEVTLAPVLAAGSSATNQSDLRLGGTTFLLSDDPNVNGAADPTRVVIDSAPVFRVEKVSTDLTGDPNVLLAGETLRYTITVQNVGTDNVTDAVLRDAVPVNTSYVPGSTMLNGAPVADLPGGVAPLSAGIPIHAPEDPTPGAMRADSSGTTSNVATIVFDVVVDSGVVDGTVISNQGFVSAILDGIVDRPSDDPATPLVDDPTRDVIGDLPLLFAAKDVAIQVDGGTLGVVDPGDVLRYTITIRNSGSVPATNVVLADTVPANTTYWPNSVTLNGLAVGQPDGGVSPLVAGIPVSSSDLTPSLPLPVTGTLTPGESAVVQFDLRVDDNVAAGTLISNQARVASAELPSLLTDGDGNPATGPEPTVVVVGGGQQLAITKTVSVVGGGAALPGSQLEYVVRVVNVSTNPATNVVVTDDLDQPVAGQLALVPGSATLNGVSADVGVTGSLLTADYSTANGPLPPGEAIVLRFLATLDAGLAIGTTVTNVGVVTWDAPLQTASSSVSVDVGGTPGVGLLSGALWHDADFDLTQDAGERALVGWSVELLRNGVVMHTALSDAVGAYQIPGLQPNTATGDQYALRFRAPGASPTSASLGRASSAFTNGPQQITDIVVASGSNLLNLDLPIQPNGVVYDAIQRTPIAGARVSLRSASGSAPLPAACFDDPAQQDQVTLGDGWYKFDLNFSNAACPSGISYLIEIAGTGGVYGSGFSGIIPPTTDVSTAPLSVPTCPGGASDAVPATAQYCEVQASEFAPPTSVPPRTPGTSYHTHLVLDASQVPGSSQLFNNHLAMDPAANGPLAITKTTPSLNVVLGQLVPYEITLRNQVSVDLLDLDVVDRFPPGFRYVNGSARLDGVPAEPTVDGRTLTWNDVDVTASSSRRLLLLLGVGAGVGEGEYVNRAQVLSGAGGIPLSSEAQATVRVVPDPDFACTDVMGKVFDDADRDGQQDAGEAGLQGVRLVTPRGLVATTDQYGRFHITCALVPHPERGSNMVLKLDDRSLPSGFRLTTRQVQVQRATRGKALRFNYGATIHRVVGLDVADAVFEPGTTEMRMQWQERIPLLLEELHKSPATVRLSYIADVEDAGLVDRRLAVVEKAIAEQWKALDERPLEIEPEIYWRRGAPPGGPMTPVPDWMRGMSLGALGLGGSSLVESDAGQATERILSPETPVTQWTQDPALLETEAGDRIEERRVVADRIETVKLKDVVPPIRFESGVSEIPESYVARLRGVLDEMQDLPNVRLHLIGHADDQPLSGALAATYGDNEGLSRERAGEAAEYLQAALHLPPEAISFSWAGASEPIASNATPEGRAKNRRVEVEVWYDQAEKTAAVEEFVVSEDIKRVKVCRVETVCKMRFVEGHERRARVRNLVAPLQIGEENARVPEEFVRQVAQVLHDLRDKQNVTVKLVGFTDNQPLQGRTARIYGSPLALSKAMARRTALAIQDALGLESSAVASDGRGAAQPLASNDTPDGRALNRRVEVEFWYDDPLQELPDEPQLCPKDAGESMLTKVYEPPWGGIPALPIEQGRAAVPDGYGELLRRAMAEIAGRPKVRLRFVGYTANEHLDRRTAMAYGDDIGLSAARARRAMQRIQAQLGLTEAQVEHEGRGFVQSNDVVNAGFIQGDSSFVAVQVVYDEPALVDDYEGVEVTPITRELRARDPMALNLMRITVDGQPIDDPGRSSADIQRCTDVALERADMQFRFDDLSVKPRLSVTSDVEAVGALPGTEPGEGGAPAAGVRFKMYTNYAHFLERAEVRVFEREQSLQDEPVAVLPVGPDGSVAWQPEAKRFAGPVRDLKFVLRAYDAKGRFDETAPQSLWIVRGAAGAGAAGGGEEGAAEDGAESRALLAGYGESELATRNIDLGRVGSVRVQGGGVPAGHSVWLAGNPVPVDENGRFVAETVLPAGTHTVEVAVLDGEGNGELFLRDLELKKSDWFYTGVADVTVSGNFTNGPADALQGENAPTDPDSIADGRFAFYVNGRFADDWKLVASADTREGPLEDLFGNFLDKSPEALFRRMDPDYFYPTYGDDGTVEETAPTLGKFYARLSQDENHALWGNFKVGYTDNELTLVERGLYGGNLHFQADEATRFGERRLVVDGFAADPGTVPAREEFRGTGGSLYYLRHRDILMGSDRLRIEIRDKDTGLVTGVVPMSPDEDYDLDYIQGRVLLSEPMASTVADRLLVRTGGLSGHEAWLVVQYEYAPGIEEIDALAAGGEAQYWFNDFFKLGATAYRNAEDSADSGLYGGHVVARKSADSWLKAQVGWSKGLVSSAFRSDDGGFGFSDLTGPRLDGDGSLAYRADGSLGFADWAPGVPGQLNVYFQRLEAGYSAPGLSAATETDQYGGVVDVPVTDDLTLTAKADRLVEDRGLETHAEEVDATYRVFDGWSLSAGVRNDDRQDESPVDLVTQEEGARTDAVVQVGFDPGSQWRSYAFGQATLRRTEERDENNRGGVGGSYRVNEQLLADGEVSYGDGGAGVRLGTQYQQSEETRRYLNYSLDNERAVDGQHAREGRLINGVRSRVSDSASVYQEDRFQHGDGSNGLSRALGMSWSPTEHWTLAADWETGTMKDRRTQAETERNAGGGRVSYRFEPLFVSSGIEYRDDDREESDGSRSERTTWLFRNSMRLQLTPDWRLLGKVNHSFSDSSRGEFFDGGYTETVVGFAYRPVRNDRLNLLAKYTYFYNMPATDQVSPQGTSVQFLQKSHVGSLDVSYDLTDRWTLGGKYAYRRGEVSLDRLNPDYFSNDAHLMILRGDWRFTKNWETSLEGRTLYLPDLSDQRSGALLTLYRYFGKNFKLGVGYNFTDYSDDLTDLSYDRHGVFVNMIGTF